MKFLDAQILASKSSRRIPVGPHVEIRIENPKDLENNSPLPAIPV